MVSTDESRLPSDEATEGETSHLLCAEAPKEVSRVQCVRAAMMDAVDKGQIWVVGQKDSVASIIRDPQFQTGTMVVAGSTVTIGAVGGAFGMAVGMVTGSVAGALPALLTFGLSIPAGGALGGAFGLCAGSAVCSGAGALAGAGTYRYRIEIKDGIIFIKQQTMDTLELGRAKTLALAESTKSKTHQTLGAAKAKADELVLFARTKADEASNFAKAKVNEAVTCVTTTKTGITCTSAAVGGITGSVAGGAAGAASGAAIGMVPAVFTLGLSIPVGATVGLCIGAATGGAAGIVGGGSAGYGGFTHRREISDGARSAWATACSTVRRVTGSAEDAAEPLKAKIDELEPACTTPIAGA